MSTSLPALIDKAMQALEEAKTLEEVKRVGAKADSLRAWGRAIGAHKHSLDRCGEIKVRAIRRIGQELKKQEKNKGTIRRGNKVLPRDDTPTLKQLGLTKMQSSRWQRIADLSDEQFQELIAFCYSEEALGP